MLPDRMDVSGDSGSGSYGRGVIRDMGDRADTERTFENSTY